MATPMKIDFVSDVSCPWCVIGLRGLDQALTAIGEEIDAELIFHPFELNPQMGRAGQNIAEHIAEKYGATPEQSAGNRKVIHDRAAELGFAMNTSADSRIYNTFDAHRLLHWAHGEGKQRALKEALFAAYFSDGRDPSDHDQLVAVAESVGLDGGEARAVLASGSFASDVRAEEQLWHTRGINAVPAIVINDKYLIQGGQPAAAFEKALRSIAAEG